MREYLKHYIDGQWVDPIRPNALEVDNPATEQISGKIALGSSADVDLAVTAARRAFGTWAQSTREERLDLLGAIMGEYQKRAAELAGRASSVTHDGAGIDGGRFIAALVSAAFSHEYATNEMAPRL